MNVFFSRSSLGFFPLEWLQDGTYTKETWPNDAIELYPNEVSKYWKVSAPIGKRLSSNRDGRPCWVKNPKPSKKEEIEIQSKIKEILTDEVEKLIKPLERAKKNGIATVDEIKRLNSLEEYSVMLMRFEPGNLSEVNWPVKPTI